MRTRNILIICILVSLLLFVHSVQADIPACTGTFVSSCHGECNVAGGCNCYVYEAGIYTQCDDMGAMCGCPNCGWLECRPPFACLNDDECDDNDACTSDECLSPGTDDAICLNELIEPLTLGCCIELGASTNAFVAPGLSGAFCSDTVITCNATGEEFRCGDSSWSNELNTAYWTDSTFECTNSIIPSPSNEPNGAYCCIFPMNFGACPMGAGGGGMNDSDCCSAHMDTGCSDQTCEDLVCAQNPFCCDTSDGFWWSGVCSDIAFNITECGCNETINESINETPDNNTDLNITIDNILGDIDSNIGVDIFADGEKNPTSGEGIRLIQIKKLNGEILVEFYYNLSNGMNLSNIIIEVENGSIAIRGIEVGKTVYIDMVDDRNSLCVMDSSWASISIMSENCDGADEIRLSCPSASPYICEVIGNRMKVSGLTHSAIRQQGYCGDGRCEENCVTCVQDCGECATDDDSGDGDDDGSSQTTTSSSSSGGCSYDWECSRWGICLDGVQKRKCTNEGSCTGLRGKPIEIQNCVEEECKWTCEKWECEDGEETRICSNGCGESKTEERGCESDKQIEISQSTPKSIPFTGRVVENVDGGDYVMPGLIILIAILGIMFLFLIKKK